MSGIEFQPWPKIARLNRDITITEKIDGTNAAVVIKRAFVEPSISDYATIDERIANNLETLVIHQLAGLAAIDSLIDMVDVARGDGTRETYLVFAQSRTRMITPENDNYGFARWVEKNAEALVAVLGEGVHFGEWWGAGIQRKYGLTGMDKRFSLFNTSRWKQGDDPNPVPGLGLVPVLYEGPFSQEAINDALNFLRDNGTHHVDAFGPAEGVVIYHHASREMYKVTLEGDEAPKGEYAHRNDEERAA